MNILYIYNGSQVYTSAVFEHISSFGRYSKHHSYFYHHDGLRDFTADLSPFDALVIHYTVRLPYDQFSPSAVEAIRNFKGLKALFIQDEYDHTKRTWYWIRHLGIKLVFTVVPEPHIASIYPPEEFPGVRFISNLTGYVPEETISYESNVPPSQRKIMFGYRARSLPVKYGQLGFEKIAIGRVVKRYCRRKNIRHDISWQENDRIYGEAWYEFMASCKAMLGSESGSNVFDWNGSLSAQIAGYPRRPLWGREAAIYKDIVAKYEQPGLMNQVSPRIFESIACRSVLVLYEGFYSGVVRENVHFISLKKDGSNLPEVVAKLNDSDFVDKMADRAYRDVIQSGDWSYNKFVRWVDDVVSENFLALKLLPSSTSPEVGDSSFVVTSKALQVDPNIKKRNRFQRLVISLLDFLLGKYRNKAIVSVKSILRFFGL